MYYNKRGNIPKHDDSQLDNSSVYSETNPNIRVGGNSNMGRSPTNTNRRGQDFDKSTGDNDPEIMLIDNNQNDRRNPMMNYSNGRQTDNRNNNSRSPITGNNPPNYRGSVLANARNDVAMDKDGNSSIPINFDAERQRSPKVINLDDTASNYSVNTRTLNQKRNQKNNNNQPTNDSEVNYDPNQSYQTDTTRRRNLNNCNNGIRSKMSPNRNNDINMDVNAERDSERMKNLKRLSTITDKIKPKYNENSHKNEYSVDTRDHLNSNYKNDLDNIIKQNKKQENFQKYNSTGLVHNNPKEGKLHTNQTQTYSAIPQSQLDEKKQAIKNINKLSTILIKDAKNQPQTNNPKSGAVKNTSNDYQEKTLRRTANPNATAGKFIRVTMSMLASKGPNSEDRIITRQTRAEKGGVVDLAQSQVKNNRSLPKKAAEVKRVVNRSPLGLRNTVPKHSAKEKEIAAKLMQKWWRGILSKYKDVIDKIVTIQKFWRRYFTRKNLYLKLYAYYCYADVIDKLDKLILRRNLLLGYEPLYNLNAERYNAIKYLRNVIYVQRFWRFYKNNRKQSSNKNVKKVVKRPNTKAYENQKKDPNNRYASNDDEDQSKNQPVLVSASNQKEKQLTDQLNKLRNKFFKTAVENALKGETKRNLTPYLLKWIKNASMGSAKTDAGRKLAATDIVRAIIKKKFDPFIKNLRAAGEKPNTNASLNRLANGILNLFNSRKKYAFGNLRKILPGIKNKVSDEFLYKILGSNLKKTNLGIMKRKLAEKFRYWRSLCSAKNQKNKDAETIVNSIKNPINRILKKNFPNFLQFLDNCQNQRKNKALKKIVSQYKEKFKYLNLPHYFSIWKNSKTEKQMSELEKKLLPKTILALFNKNNTKALAKKFTLWSAKAKENRSIDSQILLSQAKNSKLTAASKMAPALRNYLRNQAANIVKNPVLELINEKNRKATLKKILRIRPFFERYNLQKYFDKFKNNVTETKKTHYQKLLLKTYCRKLIEKSTQELLKRKLNQWWRALPHTQTTSMKGLQAVDKLKQALQKRYIKHPKEALKEKIDVGNVDWALLFIVEFKKKFLRSSIREYIMKWRNNYLGDRVNEKMKKFYAKSLYNFKKRFLQKDLGRLFNRWKSKTDTLGKNLLVSSAKNINNSIKNLYQRKMKKYYDHLIKGLGQKKKITKHQVACGILSNLYLNRDLYNLGKRFRLWSKNVFLKEIGILRSNLIARILNPLIKGNDKNNQDGKLYKWFNRWVNVTEKDLEKIRTLKAFIDRYINSTKFHDKYIRKNVDDLLDVAEHLNRLKKKQALKISDFMAAILAIYRRINIMKRQKAIIEAMKKMSFLEKMQIMTAVKRWQNKTALVNNDEKATVLQGFIRDLYKFKNNKAVLAEKAKLSLDNYTKRLVFFKMSEAARLNKMVSILMKLFSYIPNELRKNYLRKSCVEWNNYAKSLKHNNASEKILGLLKGYIIRRFVYKLKLKKHLMQEIVRRGLKRFVNEKLFYMTEWARIARLLSLKNNALALATWIPQKFNGFKKLKAYRALADLLKKKQFQYIVDTLKSLGKTSILVDTIQNLNFKKYAPGLWNGLKTKYFKKKFAPIFGELLYQFRHFSVYYYAKKWRDRVMDEQQMAIIKIQARVRMMLKKLQARRQLRRNKLMLSMLMKIYWDAKLAKQGYINLWRNIIQYKKIDDQVNIIAKIIKGMNEKKDYEKEIASKNIKKLFDKYMVSNVRNTLIDCRNYKDSVVDVLKNLNSKIEKRYAINNLVDFGKDTIRNSLVELITGKQDKLTKNSLIRQAIEKWRHYNARLLYFVMKLQKMRRGKVRRDFLEKSKKMYDLMTQLTLKFLNDKQLKAVRINQWKNRALHFSNKENANTIQKFLRNHLNGILLKRLQDLINNGFRNHFLFCLGQVSKFKKLKNSIARPLNSQAMEKIRRRFILLKIRDMLADLMDSATEDNKKIHKEEIIKLWRKQIQKINEKEKFSALLIVASIKAKLMKLRIKRWKDLSLRVKSIIYKAFGGNDGLKRCFVLQWIKNSKQIALQQSRDTLAQHATEILNKIKNTEHKNREDEIKDGVETILDVAKKNIAKNLLNKILHKSRKTGLERVQEIYTNAYLDRTSEGLRKIKAYGLYRLNLIKKIQKFWKTQFRLWKFIMKIRLMRKAMQYALDKELALKHAYTLLWKNNTQRINDKKNSNVLQDFCRKILEHQRQKKGDASEIIKNLALRIFSKNNIYDVFRKLRMLMFLKNCENMIVRKHFNFFKFKTLILYILYILHGQFNKVEAKVKSTCAYKFRKIALHMQKKEAANNIIRCLKEIKNRKHDNNIRDVIVRIAIGRTLDQAEIKMRAASEWCRNAHVLKAKENIKAIDKFLTLKKRCYDLNKKWQKWGSRLQAKNGILSSNVLSEKINLFRQTEPFVRFINRRNIAKNGRDLLLNIKRKLILMFIKQALKSACGIVDKETLKNNTKLWRLNMLKYKKRDEALDNALESVRRKLLEIAFRRFVGAHDFKRYAGLARLVLLHSGFRKLKQKAEANRDLCDLTDALKKYHDNLNNNGISTFKDKLYKFYVYKLLANMGALFLKVRDLEFKEGYMKNFWNNFKKQSKHGSCDTYSEKLKVQRAPNTMKKDGKFTQTSVQAKKDDLLFGKSEKGLGKAVRLFIPFFNKMVEQRKEDFINFIAPIKKCITLVKNLSSKQKRWAFTKLLETMSGSMVRANAFVLLRKAYLKKKLREIESANRFLMMNHLLKLITVTKEKVSSRYVLNNIRKWKFNVFSRKLKKEKEERLKENIEAFSKNILEELFHGPNNITKHIDQFNKELGVYDNPKIGAMNKKAKDANNSFKIQKSLSKPIKRNNSNHPNLSSNGRQTTQFGASSESKGKSINDTIGYSEARAKSNQSFADGNLFNFNSETFFI